MARRPTRRNPFARIVKKLRPNVVTPKKGKGSYRRKGRTERPANAGGRQEKKED